jgi:peptide/nickel transport system permease protein
MLNFILKRIGISVLLLFGILTLTFAVIHSSPGNPVNIYISERVHPAVVEQIKINLGLNEPVWTQYFKWLGVIPPFHGFIEGDFGYSFSMHKPVADVIIEAIPNTLLLTLSALGFNLIIGIIIGILSGLKENSKFDNFTGKISIILYSIPEFWLAIITVLVFSSLLAIFPSSQMHSIDYYSMTFTEKLWDNIKHLFLPVFVLGISSSAATIRYMRGSIIDIKNKQYILYAKMKGLSDREIFRNHILKNSLPPIITLTGLYFPFLLSSSAIIEYIFAWPGLGRIAIESIYMRDYPLIIGITFLSGLLVLAGNFLSDFLNALLDPRIR